MEHRSKKNRRRDNINSNIRHCESSTEHSPISITTAGQAITKQLTPTRGGIIIYTTYHQQIYLGLAVDSQTHDLTDFGGQLYYDSDPDCIAGSLREFQEETMGIFAPLTAEHVAPYTSIHDEANIITFLHLAVHPDQVSAAFLNAHSEHIRKLKKKPEVCGITWLSMDEFTAAVATPGVLYQRLQKVLSQVTPVQWETIL